jgi:hypothetical protein
MTTRRTLLVGCAAPSFLTDDIWYTEAIDYYQRMKGREAVLAFFGDTVKTSDLSPPRPAPRQPAFTFRSAPGSVRCSRRPARAACA